MDSIQKSRYCRMICWTTATVLFIAFIFGNSMQNAAESSEMSGGVVEWIENLFAAMGAPITISEHFIRKAAHFSEYAVLGILMGATLRAYTPKVLSHVFVALFAGLAVPVTDECIQLFVEGRAGMVADVLLDFSGFVTGLWITIALIYWIGTKRKRKQDAINADFSERGSLETDENRTD